MPNMSLKKNEMPSQAPDVRNKNFLEVALGYTEEQALDEAQRCQHCTNKPCVAGCPVGYLYREEPLDPNAPDSGWRIFAGDETPDYMADATRFEFYHLNTICNYDPSILELLNAPAPTAYRREGDGWRQERR